MEFALPERSSERTTGVCGTADGTQVEVVSGGDEESAPVDLILADSQHFPRPRLDGGFGVSTHVETKIAYRMRTLGITYAAVIVNNRVCGGPFSRTEAVPAILPRGYTLAVWQPGAGKPLLLKGKAQP